MVWGAVMQQHTKLRFYWYMIAAPNSMDGSSSKVYVDSKLWNHITDIDHISFLSIQAYDMIQVMIGNHCTPPWTIKMVALSGVDTGKDTVKYFWSIKGNANTQ